MRNQIVGLAVAAVGAASAYAQGGFGYPSNGGYGTNIGYGGTGKCTVEAEVDQVADVLITGSNVQIRTLAGGQASLIRSNCNAPLPAYPAGFRFQGVDGRGRQTLLADPASNRGTAVVRIEDPAGGRERYTFDLFWSGSDGANNSSVYSNGAYGYPSNGYPSNGYPNNGYPANGYPNGGYPVYGNNYPNNGYPVYGNAYPNNGNPGRGRPHRRRHDDDDDDDRGFGRNRR